MSVDVGQASFETVVVKRQPLVVEPQQVQDRRVEVVDGRHILDGFETEFVSRSVAEWSFDAGPGQPRGKAGRVVVSTAGSLLESRHATKLGTPDDERVFEQPSLFEILEQRGRRLIEHLPMLFVLRLQRLVTVTVTDALAACLISTVEQLDESHPLLNQSSSEHAVLRVGRL